MWTLVQYCTIIIVNIEYGTVWVLQYLYIKLLQYKYDVGTVLLSYTVR